MSNYKYLNHTADLGIEVRGKTLKELFVNIAKAIFETEISGRITTKEEIIFEIESASLEDLFIEWCRELIYNFSVKGFVPKKYDISIKKYTLSGLTKGEIFNPQKHKVKLEIKSPTYHNFKIEKRKKFYQATIIFDV